jgi:hypothetical protein
MIYSPTAPRQIIAHIAWSIDQVQGQNLRPIEFQAIFIHPVVLEELVKSASLRGPAFDTVAVNRIFGMTIEEHSDQREDPGYFLQFKEV